MEFDKKLDYIFEKHKLEKDRNIKLEVLVNDEDLLVKNEFVHDV
jgi:hypothetical protein